MIELAAIAALLMGGLVFFGPWSSDDTDDDPAPSDRPTEGPDLLAGTPGDDDILGLGGNDTITGAAGNDRLSGGAGFVLIRGGDGTDELFGDGGADTLLGGQGDDLDFGDVGNDELRGGAGDDRLVGGRGNDLLLGEDGGDALSGGTGSDTLIGGAGFDSLITEGNGNLLDGGADPDTLRVTGNDSLLLGGTGVDNLTAVGNDNLLEGGLDDDTIFSVGSGNVLFGDSGSLLEGGGGNDVLHGAITDRLSDTSGTWPAVTAGPDTLRGGDGNDLLFGHDSGEVLDGGRGDDTLVALGPVGTLDDTGQSRPTTPGMTLTGGDGADRFDIRTDALITDFEPGTDTLGLTVVFDGTGEGVGADTWRVELLDIGTPEAPATEVRLVRDAGLPGIDADHAAQVVLHGVSAAQVDADSVESLVERV